MGIILLVSLGQHSSSSSGRKKNRSVFSQLRIQGKRE
ncbi:hypothetical protein X975_10085, partial [Stegodyphus mimosarum]